MDQKDNDVKLFNINFEEITPDRSIVDGQFVSGTHNYRFNVSPSGGGCIIPNRCYFLVEYSFGEFKAGTDGYTAEKALSQSKKITLASDFVSNMFNSCAFRIAGTDVQVVNSFLPHASMIRKRLKMENNYMNKLAPDLLGVDNDFSRRLSRYCSDGLLHRDGLIDATPYNSQPLSSSTLHSPSDVYAHNGNLLGRNANGTYVGTIMSAIDVSPPAGANYLHVYADYYGGVLIAAAAVDTVLVGSISWLLPAGSALYSTSDVLIDTKVFNVGGKVKLFTKTAAGTAAEIASINKVNNMSWEITGVKGGGVNSAQLIISPEQSITLADYKAAFIIPNPATTLPESGFITVLNSDPYSQPDPRSNIVNGEVVWTPPLAFFDEDNFNLYYGDIQLNLTPNLNYKKAIVESCQSTYYGQDVNWGVDYAFGIKSMRLYICRANLPAYISPSPQISEYPIQDMLIANKTLNSATSSLDFTIPYSTSKIIVFIQDATAGLNTKISMNRFKTRQYTGALDPGGSNAKFAGLTQLNKYGQYAHTFDETLQSIQVTFAGIVKPMTNFQSGNTVADSNPNKVSMLQRWLMSAQNVNIREPRETECFTDWLSMGPMYIFDFEKPSDNTGTMCIVRTTFAAGLGADSAINGIPTQGLTATDATQASVNLFVCAIYNKNMTIAYSEFGQILNVQMTM